MKITMNWREVELSRQRYDETFEVADDFVVTERSLRGLAVEAECVNESKSDGCEVVAYEIIHFSIAD